jgi:RNA polymerase sigma factor (sigma-70 family)
MVVCILLVVFRPGRTPYGRQAEDSKNPAQISGALWPTGRKPTLGLCTQRQWFDPTAGDDDFIGKMLSNPPPSWRIETYPMKKNADDWIPTRQSLLSKLRNWDDHQSWDQFFSTYWKLIYNVARRSGLRDAEAQEVVQETVIAVARRIPKFRYDPAKGSFKGWLLQTTQWRISDQFRKRGAMAAPELVSGEEGEIDGGGASPQAVLEAVESRWEAMWRENLIEAAMDRVKQRADPREFQMFEMLVKRDWPP